MFSNTPILSILFLFFSCHHFVSGVPIHRGLHDIEVVTAYLPNYVTVFISLGALLLFAYFVLGCVCCPNKNIKALSYQNGFPVSRLNDSVLENPNEITIFPPQSTVIDLQPVCASYPSFEEKITFEPLPDILPRKVTSGQSAACSSRPAHFSALLKSKVSLHDWFDDPNSNFPRDQLQYFQELGCGWFGCVVQGEAAQICDNEEKTPVIVKILREEATPSEHLHFLHEVRPYRDLKHSNVVQLLGRCLESDPFLLIMEHSICDLKTFLINQDNRDRLIQDGNLFSMVSNIVSGLRYMHDKGFCHMDFAAHNCFVCKDNVVKIGDYGISFEKWKDDYYCLGDIALPIRWYSPEMVLCSETTIETKDVTKEANVWAFGVILWEVFEFGKLPYDGLTNEDVLQKVLIEKSVQLPPPAVEMPYKDEVSLVMRECWRPKRYRPTMEKIDNFIIQFCSDIHKNKELTFEERWNSIQPRITEISSYTGTESSSFKFENDFSTRSDLANYSSDNEILSSFEMSFDIHAKSNFNAQLSPSLNVLNGSIDELTENDVYLNSMSLSCGRYDADTLSNISDKDNFQMEDDKDNLQPDAGISEHINAAVKDLDLILASQLDSRSSTLKDTVQPVNYSSLPLEKHNEAVVDIIFSESRDVSRSPALSNISEVSREILSSKSESSNLVENCSSKDKLEDGNKNVCSVLSENSFRSTNYVAISLDNELNEEPYKTPKWTLNNVPEVSNESIEETLIPDIVVHEPPSLDLEDKFDENPIVSEFKGDSPNSSVKKFKFVFKDDTNTNTDLEENLVTDCSKQVELPAPLTSTPVKSSDSFLYKSFPDMNYHISDSAITSESTYDVFYDISSNSVARDSAYSKEMEDQYSKPDDEKAITGSPDLSSMSNQEHFTTAQSVLTNSTKASQSSLHSFENHSTTDNEFGFEKTNIANSTQLQNESNSTILYVSADSDLINVDDNFKQSPKLISPPSGYTFSGKSDVPNFSDENTEASNEFLENIHIRVSDTVSPPQGFQDDSSILLNDSLSESKTSFDHELSYSAESGSNENLDQDFVHDEKLQNSTLLLESSFPDVTSKSFAYETNADFAGNMRPKKSSSFSSNCVDQNPFIYHSDYMPNDYQNYSAYDNMKQPIPSYDQMIVEDLDTGEQTVINESYVCDDYENSAESDDILRINTETDEAIIVDSSEALIGFVPSRSIELLQEIDVIPPLNASFDEERESSESMNNEICNSASPSPGAMIKDKQPYNTAYLQHHYQNDYAYESPKSNYLHHPQRNFCLQNEVIEEEITDEIVSPSSFHSSSSYCSNEIFLEEEKMSQSSESAHQGEVVESVLPSMDHLYEVSDDGSKTDISSSECSPLKEDVVNSKYRIDQENNQIPEEDEDVMYSYQPSQSVRWLSNETLDVEDDHSPSPIIIEGREILAGDIIQTCELTAEDIASALNELEAKGQLKGLNTNLLNVSPSPSPFSSVESSPCRDVVYTPDFESESEETGSGTSCSSTSGSFECIHNKFKNITDVSKVAEDSEKSASSREVSPMKVFSKTWDCHATPTKGVLVTPEKKFSSMKKSVSFHEEDPQVVFEYPPASDSSEDGYPADDTGEDFRNIDYLKYADWDLQISDDLDGEEIEEILEIEELDSEPYVRRPVYSSSSVGPLNRPMLYTLTSGFSDEDDFSDTMPTSQFSAPSNSPEEGKCPISGDAIAELIQNQLSNLAEEETKLKHLQSDFDNPSSGIDSYEDYRVSSVFTSSVQVPEENSVSLDDIVVEELLPDAAAANYEFGTVHGSTAPTSDSEGNAELLVGEDDFESRDSLNVSKSDCSNMQSLSVATEVEILSDCCGNSNFKPVSEIIEGNKNNLSSESVSSNEAAPSLSDIKNVSEKEFGKSLMKSENSSEEFASALDDLQDVVNGNFYNETGSQMDSFDDEITAMNSSNDHDLVLRNTPGKSLNSFEFYPDVIKDTMCDSSATVANEDGEIFPSTNVSEFTNAVSVLGKKENHPSNISDTAASVMFENKNGNISGTSNTSAVLGMRDNNIFHSDIISDNTNDAVLCSKIDVDTKLDLEDSSTASINRDRSYKHSVVDQQSYVFHSEERVHILETDAHSNDSGIDFQDHCNTNMSSVVSHTDKGEKMLAQDEVLSVSFSSKDAVNIPEILTTADEPLEKAAGAKENIVQLNPEKESLLVPEIVVTPASESEMEDEIEEGLQEHLNSVDNNKEKNFSVTSQYSDRPFDDIFGSYISGDSPDYIEAFNFELNDEDLFEVYEDDFSCMPLGDNHRLYVDSQPKRASSLPLVTDSHSDDDSLTIKSDSSLKYDSTKGITRL